MNGAQVKLEMVKFGIYFVQFIVRVAVPSSLPFGTDVVATLTLLSFTESFS